MDSDSGRSIEIVIPVKNIYYMLSYAFQMLKEQGYTSIATEEFKNTADLMSEILIRGTSVQIKRGLSKEYINQTDAVSAVRGKIHITESIKKQSMLKKQLICSFDKYSVNIRMNQIIKSTLLLLLKADIASERKKRIRKLLIYLSDVETIDLKKVDWKLSYHRNNQTYQMLISVCYMVVKGLLHTNDEGNLKIMDFLDEQRMCRLYEKFILEYYRREFPQLSANPSEIMWQLDDDINTMLPVMRTDIMLQYQEKILIIDAKYYSHILQTNYEGQTIQSQNLYQIFSYVKNKEYELRDKKHEVSGMLLYAKTDETVIPNYSYQMSGNRISVKTLDLNGSFEIIKKQLDQIIEDHFGTEIK